MNLTCLSEQLRALTADSDTYATQFVDLLLEGTQRLKASDVHLQPTRSEIEIRVRIDGVLQPLGQFARGSTTDVIARLKVLASLLTYRTDVPQEGRIGRSDQDLELRVSTFPTIYGERAVVRCFARPGQLHRLTQLGFPPDVLEGLQQLLMETTGALLITGPAGSGKTTTAYACLRELVAASDGGRSLVTLEDPVEVAVSGVAQSQVNAAAGLTLATGLKSLLRQDPEVILVGEIRDPETATIAVQAALTGQLVLSTFHAGSAVEAIGRLADMGIEPYLLRSAIRGILAQRLVRRLCACAAPEPEPVMIGRATVAGARRAAGCEQCHHTGYQGRIPLVELLQPEPGAGGAAILAQRDSYRLAQRAESAGMVPLIERARQAIADGLTTAAEVVRVLGVARNPDAVSHPRPPLEECDEPSVELE